MACAEANMNKLKLNQLLGETEVCVMLVGASGAGKSSLIDSLIKLINSSDVSPNMKLTQYLATAKSQFMGGHTMMRESFELTDTLTIMDNRSWHDWENDASLKELIAQINGQSSLDDVVKWNRDDTDSPLTLNIPLVSPKVDCVCIVIDGQGGIEVMNGIGKLIETCRKNVRRRLSVVITHKDMVSPEKIENIRATLETVHGVDPNRIFAIKNITPLSKDLEADSKALLIDFIRCCYDDGESGSTIRQRREETKSKLDRLAKREEEKRKAKDISNYYHEIETLKATEKIVQLQIVTEAKKRRAELENEILENKREHELRMQAAAEKSKAKINQIDQTLAEIGKLYYLDYVEKAYTKRLDAIPKTEVVSFERLNSTPRICEPFTMDFTDQSDMVAVSLKAGQNEKLEVNHTFHMKFTTCHRTARDASQTLRTSHQTGEKNPGNHLGEQEDFDETLRIVAEKVFERAEIDKLGKALGFDVEEIKRFVATNIKTPDVSYMGTLSMLRKWRKKQTKSREHEALMVALKKAGQINLADELFGTRETDSMALH